MHFLILWIFLQFFWNFQLSVRYGRNETIIFIFPLSHPLSIDFVLKLTNNGIFYFFWIFCYELRRNETEWQYLFSFFLSLFQPTVALNDAILALLNFLNFFVIFLKFSIIHQVGTERNYNFYFLSFSSSFNRFWTEIKP